jgi:hypothetical protein
MRTTVTCLVLALISGSVIAAGGSAHQPGAGASIPEHVAVIQIASAAGLEPPSVKTTVSARAKVHQIVAWIDQMKPVAPGFYTCGATAGIEPTVSLTFRASRTGRVLARASETDAGFGSGQCNPLTISRPGDKPVAVIGGMFLERVERLVGVDLGFGFGKIDGTLVRAGGPLPSPSTHRHPPAGDPSPFMVNVYLAHPRAFPGYGNGLLFGSSVNRHEQFSIGIAPGAYLLNATQAGRKPDCQRITAIVRVGHTTHTDIPVGCTIK